jgi:pimeloyl-ACP methyl ester carboxylesterase
MKKAYADIPAGQMFYWSEGQGAPLLLIHQSSFSSFEYENIIPILAKKFRVIAPDTLGYGYSDPAPLQWGFLDFVRSFVDFLDAVGIKKASIVGHHTGALIAAELGASYPDRVDKLVLSGCAVYEPELRKQKYAKQMALPPQGSLPPAADGSHSIGMWKKQQEENPDSPPDNVHRAMIANFLHYDKPGTGNAFTALLGYDIEPTLKHIRKPTLVLAGTKDVIKPPSFKPADTAARLIPGARFKWIEGGAILVAYEMPDAFAGAVLEFLAS